MNFRALLTSKEDDEPIIKNANFYLAPDFLSKAGGYHLLSLQPRCNNFLLKKSNASSLLGADIFITVSNLPGRNQASGISL